MDDASERNRVMVQIVQQFFTDLPATTLIDLVKQLEKNCALFSHFETTPLFMFPQILRIILSPSQEQVKLNTIFTTQKELFLFEPWKKKTLGYLR